MAITIEERDEYVCVWLCGTVVVVVSQVLN